MSYDILTFPQFKFAKIFFLESTVVGLHRIRAAAFLMHF